MIKARLCYHHNTTSRSFQAATLREILDPAIRVFPDNTAFLNLYVWNEARTRIDNRVRTMLYNVVLNERNEDETVLKWTFAIWAELQMDASRGFNQNAVRNLFEKAVECERYVLLTLTCRLLTFVHLLYLQIAI